MKSVRHLILAAGAVGLLIVPARADDKSAIVGAWTLNHELSDRPAAVERAATPERGRRNGGGGRGGGGRGGGFGRGGGQRGGGRAAANPDEVARMRDAMRDITEPADHLTITLTESMVVLTSSDGRTTRLSPDGKKIKDENTGIERKTRWDGVRLVSEINGLGRGKITQTFAADPETRRLRVSVAMEGGGGAQGRTTAFVYDADQPR